MTGFVPTSELPPIQEQLRTVAPEDDYGLWVLVACTLLQRAGRAQARRALVELLDRWPTADRLAAAPLPELARAVRCCGFQTRRSQTIALLAVEWPRRRRELARDPELVLDLPGCGPYARDAFRIFALGHSSVRPADRVLQAWLAVVKTTPR